MADTLYGTALEAGCVVGSYRAVRPVAESPVGALWRVEHLATGERRLLVAARAPLPSGQDFVRLVRAVRSIPCEHIAEVVDAGQDEASGLRFCVTEFLPGRTLAQELATGTPFTLRDSLLLIDQLADALRSAHAAGVVHGGLSPASLVVVHSPPSIPGLPMLPRVQAKLFDLAIVAAVHPEDDTHADIRGLARVAYALLGGRMPGTFDAWFARCHDLDPSSRFRHVREAYEALIDIARQRTSPARRSTVLPPPALPPLAPPPAPRVDSDAPVELFALEEEVALLREQGVLDRLRFTPRTVGGITIVAALFGVALRVLVDRSPAALHAATRATPVELQPGGEAKVPVILRLHGSNTIGAELVPALAEAFLAHRPGTHTLTRRHPAPDETLVEALDAKGGGEAIEVAAHGSATAFEDLGAGRCDIGMSSRRIKDAEASSLSPLGNLASPASEQVIAMDGIAVIVNPANRTSSLTTRQIAGIFAGTIRRWSEVGGGEGAIVVHARDGRSGTYDTFRHLVLAGGEVSDEAVRHESSDELSDAVADDPRAIGFIGLPYVRSAKAVLVQDEGTTPMLPSSVTVSTEDYPLSRRLYLYLARSAPAVARELVDFALSEEGQKVVAATGFVDLRPACEPSVSCVTCSPEYRALVRGACRISTDFRFDRSSALLDNRALRDLQRVSTMLGRPENGRKSVLLLGFSDTAGSAAQNLALSRRRASMVAEQLRARGLLVGAERGFGGAMPVSDDSTPEGRQRNRRVELWIR